MGESSKKNEEMNIMKELIAAFPQNITEALQIAKAKNYSTPSNEIKNIVVCGMGGSGIGGQLVQKWVEDELSIPMTGVHAYSLPNFVNENTLVIASSYSGNTEETLACINEAISKKAHIIGITSGGSLEKICEENDYDCTIVPGGNPPRTALAFSIVQLLSILSQLGLTSSQRLEEIEKARQLIVSEEVNIKKKAFELAQFLEGKVGILYGTTSFEPMLIRARQQFNENGKLLCWHHTIPEMNHNELVGWGGGDDRFATVFFIEENILPRNQRRVEISKNVALKKESSLMEISTKGESFIEQTLYLVNIVDWASLYLSDIKNVDPIDIEVIDYLKNELANFK